LLKSNPWIICCFSLKVSSFSFVPMFAVLNKKVQPILKFTRKFTMGSQSTTFQLILKFTHGSLQWVHKAQPFNWY
jgi:hypothetical protein